MSDDKRRHPHDTLTAAPVSAATHPPACACATVYAHVRADGGVDYTKFGSHISRTLSAMPGGRCPYPPLDVPGPGSGFDAEGAWVGAESARGGEAWRLDESVLSRTAHRHL